MSLVSQDDRRVLLGAARAAVMAAASGRILPAPPAGGVAALSAGAFVTLHVRDTGTLRGCIGSFSGVGTLGETVVRMAAAAAIEDPRFFPVRPAEVDGLRIDISVLGPMTRSAPEKVEPGLHGVYVRLGRNAGTLLPQVATEEGWDREQLLSHACLMPDSFRMPGGRRRD